MLNNASVVFVKYVLFETGGICVGKNLSRKESYCTLNVKTVG